MTTRQITTLDKLSEAHEALQAAMKKLGEALPLMTSADDNTTTHPRLMARRVMVDLDRLAPITEALRAAAVALVEAAEEADR